MVELGQQQPFLNHLIKLPSLEGRWEVVLSILGFVFYYYMLTHLIPTQKTSTVFMKRKKSGAKNHKS